MALQRYHPELHPAEVSTAAPEPAPLTLRDELIRTLICPVCKLIFRSPISTCTFGHSICYACTTKLGQCGVCSASLPSMRNFTIESQLSLVEVECGIPSCPKRVKASKLYVHFGKCEFRVIHCGLPILTAGTTKSGARIDCAAVSPFQDYIYHLTQVHGVRRYELTNPEGLYDFGYDATGEDVLGFHDVVSAMTVPIPLLAGNKSFLLHSRLSQQQFSVWVSAMFSEEEASEFAVTIKLYRKGYHTGHQFPEWEIRAHNYHVGKSLSEAGRADQVTIPSTLLRRYAENHSGKWLWYIHCQIAKSPLVKQEYPEITID